MEWVQTTFLFSISVIFAFILVVSISTLIDKKLGNISITLPKMNIASPGSVTVPQEVTIIERFDAESEKQKLEKLKKKVQKLPTFEKEAGKKTAADRTRRLKKLKGKIQKLPKSEKKKEKVNYRVGCKQNSDCNIVYGNGKNVCKSDNTCQCLEGSGEFCHLGPTNYKDPADMTHNEREAFKKSYRSNFTLQDYINWLKLFRNDDDYLKLREEHRVNYKKLLMGEKITKKDMPMMVLTKVPRNDRDYFVSMYTNRGRIQYPHDIKDPSPLLAYNYSDYSEFIPPQELRDTWHTGIVDLYKDNKFSARELNSYLRPDANTGLVEKRIGDNYLHGNFYITPPGDKFNKADPFLWVD